MKPMKEKVGVTAHLAHQAMKAIKDVIQNLVQDHSQDKKVIAAEEGLEVGQDQGAIAEAGAERMESWTQLIVKMLDARQNIVIFKRNGRKKRGEMNMKVLIGEPSDHRKILIIIASC